MPGLDDPASDRTGTGKVIEQLLSVTCPDRPLQREQFFGAMSSRAADGLRDEIEMRGRVKKSEVETAQKEVVAIAKRLIAQGDIIMGEGDEDYV